MLDEMKAIHIPKGSYVIEKTKLNRVMMHLVLIGMSISNLVWMIKLDDTLFAVIALSLIVLLSAFVWANISTCWRKQ